MDQAEKLRSVVKLKKQNYKPDARVITVTSGKGGVGKSNVAVNLAVQMQKMGKRVLVFDADFGLANVEVMFGAIPKYNLADVIYHGKQITVIMGSVKQTEQGAYLTLDPERTKAIMASVEEEVAKLENMGKPAIIMTSPIVRMYFKKLTEDYFKDLTVLSYNEVESNVELQSVGMVTI